MDKREDMEAVEVMEVMDVLEIMKKKEEFHLSLSNKF